MLQEKISNELKQALKAGDAAKVSTLRFLLSAVHNRAIELRTNGQELNDEEVLGVIRRQLKQHRESVESFEAAGRAELAAKEAAELALLQSYLPSQLGEAEVRNMVKEAIERSSGKDLGSIMKVVMPKLKGQADGALVRRVVEEALKN